MDKVVGAVDVFNTITSKENIMFIHLVGGYFRVEVVREGNCFRVVKTTIPDKAPLNKRFIDYSFIELGAMYDADVKITQESEKEAWHLIF